MAEFLNSDPNADWPGQIPLIETDDPVLGGIGGPVNVPHQLLANRTAYLKRILDAIETELVDLRPLIDHIEDTSPHEATSEATPERLVLRDAAGRAQVAGPAANGDIANKGYVDEQIGGISGADVTKEYVDTHIGASNVHNATIAPTANRLVIRDASGRAQIETPIADKDIANKTYVDGKTSVAGTGFWGWNTASNLTNISSISGCKVGDYIVNTGTATRTMLGVSAAIGAVIKSTSATAGSAAGNIRGVAGATGEPGEPGPPGPAGSTAWSAITGKPSTFPPENHTHSNYSALGHTHIDYLYNSRDISSISVAFVALMGDRKDVYLYITRADGTYISGKIVPLAVYGSDATRYFVYPNGM